MTTSSKQLSSMFDWKELRNTLLVIINLWVWYPIINPEYITIKVLLVVGGYFLLSLVTGHVVKFDTLKTMAFFFLVLDIASLVLGPYYWLAVLFLVGYIVYKVTTNPLMVRARKDLRDAIDSVEVVEK